MSLPEVNDLLPGTPIDDRDPYVSVYRPHEDQPVRMHGELNLLRLRGVEVDRQVIAGRDEPVAAFGFEIRRETRRVVRALKLDDRDMPMGPSPADPYCARADSAISGLALRYQKQQSIAIGSPQVRMLDLGGVRRVIMAASRSCRRSCLVFPSGGIWLRRTSWVHCWPVLRRLICGFSMNW